MHFDVYSKYHYSRLSDYGKEVYLDLMNAIYSFKKEINIRLPLKSNEFSDVIFALNYDIPEFFYIDLSSITVMSGISGFRITFEYLYSKNEVERIITRILDMADDIQKRCKNATASVRPERIIHDYIVNRTHYAVDGICKDSYSIKGALIDGAAVCEGFAFSFKLFCDICKIPCIIVLGEASKEKGHTEKHAWNIVRCGRTNFHIDVTWDELSAQSRLPAPYYKVSDEFIACNHYWSVSEYPKCSSKGEFEKSVKLVDTTDTLDSLVCDMAKAKRKTAILRFNQRIDSIAEAQNVIRHSIDRVGVINITSFAVHLNVSLNIIFLNMNYGSHVCRKLADTRISAVRFFGFASFFQTATLFFPSLPSLFFLLCLPFAVLRNLVCNLICRELC